jgi:hypothetical protein
MGRTVDALTWKYRCHHSPKKRLVQGNSFWSLGEQGFDVSLDRKRVENHQIIRTFGQSGASYKLTYIYRLYRYPHQTLVICIMTLILQRETTPWAGHRLTDADGMEAQVFAWSKICPIPISGKSAWRVSVFPSQCHTMWNNYPLVI